MPGAVRVQAAVAILDRGCGRPKQSVEVQVDHDTTELAAVLNERVQIVGPVVEESGIIDVTVVETVKPDRS